jgi:hypothetical protein
MWCSILSILFSGSTQRGALERFHVFNGDIIFDKPKQAAYI